MAFPSLRDIRILQRVDKVQIFWYITTCRLVSSYPKFRPRKLEWLLLYSMYREENSTLLRKVDSNLLLCIAFSALCNISEDLNLHCIYGGRAEPISLLKHNTKLIFPNAIENMKNISASNNLLPK